MPVVPHLLCTSSARSHKAQSLAQYCSCCTWLILRTLSTDTVTLHSFADDMQLYLHCCHEDITTAATRLKDCIIDVGHWMSTNRLKLNTDKTELLWTGSRHSISQLHGHGPSIQLGADTVPACDHVSVAWSNYLS